MKLDTREIQAVAATQPARFDLYADIHKAMRAMMSDVLLAVGRMDPDDAEELSHVSGRVLELLDFCAAHVRHENEFVHPAIEARSPGASAALAHEHETHVQDITRLQAAVATLCRHSGSQQAAGAAQALYRELAMFVGHNFTHMHVEETAHNTILWARYTDAELLELHARLVASIAPADMMTTLRWMVPAQNPAERTALLSDMQAHAPAPVLEAALAQVRPYLNDPDWAKLTRSLGLAPVPGLVMV
ncbi:hemerythrin domain-containing protein [Rhodoferax sp.]|uniref:hemerythrin domain-containing protein n=1 Tax=Rhodoferax sp. TaxID=50421 RepID=UPI00261B4365|nr:hemerythrin domain-containing protein [Rhodoferax sp.]MDD2925585.1 hemerythrin domain-containing protein [Rhodoferax sp.]